MKSIGLILMVLSMKSLPILLLEVFDVNRASYSEQRADNIDYQ